MKERYKPGDVRISAKVILLDAGNAIFTMRRAAHDLSRGGAWDLPGGAARSDESPPECAVRETLKETGFRLPKEALSLVWMDRRPSRKGPHINERHFFCAVIGLFQPEPPRLNPSEAQAHDWGTLDQVRDRLGHPVQQEALGWLVSNFDAMQVTLS